MSSLPSNSRPTVIGSRLKNLRERIGASRSITAVSWPVGGDDVCITAGSLSSGLRSDMLQNPYEVEDTKVDCIGSLSLVGREHDLNSPCSPCLRGERTVGHLQSLA